MTYDVAIVGAGVSGCTAAILYGRAGLRVLLIDKRSVPTAELINPRVLFRALWAAGRSRKAAIG